MRPGSRVRRWLGLATIAALSFGFLFCANPFWGVLSDHEAKGAARARQLGIHLEKMRRQEIAAVEGIAEALRETRGAFYGGVLDLTLDAKGRLLVGGWEDAGRWLGILRFRPNGKIDEDFLREVSRNFENDSVVGPVNQVLPLDDGHILAVGYFRKPQTGRARADDPGGISFVLLEESGRVDEKWLEGLWPMQIAVTGPVYLEAERNVTFLDRGALQTLSIGPPPQVGVPVPLGDPRVRAICPLSSSEILIFAPPKLTAIRRDGSTVRDMTALVDDKGWGGGWRQLFCAPDGRALAVFEQTVHVPDHEAGFGLTITHILVIDRDAIAVNEMPEAIRPAAAYYSERRGHWLVQGDLGRHHGLIIITSQPPYAVPERPLHSIDVVAMIDREDGGLLLAGRRRQPTASDSIRPTRLFQLAAGATEPAPY